MGLALARPSLFLFFISIPYMDLGEQLILSLYSGFQICQAFCASTAQPSSSSDLMSRLLTFASLW
jgi:hypothetical protein